MHDSGMYRNNTAGEEGQTGKGRTALGIRLGVDDEERVVQRGAQQRPPCLLPLLSHHLNCAAP